MSRPWYEVLGGRKFALASGTLGMGFILALLSKLTPEFTGIAMLVNAAYSAANTMVTNKALDAGSVNAK